MGIRKYPEVKGWWVYSIYIPSVNKYYIGVSKQKCCQRWVKSKYESMALKQYLDEWDSMVRTVLIDGLSSKEEALIHEDSIIRALTKNNLCINERRSGLIYLSDINAYNRELYHTNTEYRERVKQRKKQYEFENKEKIRERKKQYYQNKKLEHEHTSLQQ